jgi:aerotaxis receptor
MRVNLPITDQEYPFPRGATLVSVTDSKGRILYCNEMFVEVSGFTTEELLGQPHNLIRHPDVPEEAFRDLWETIKSGRPWSAVLKNRRKDGSHYWVVANVTPLSDDGEPTGYMSVRTEATREQIEEAEYLFEHMRAEKEAGRLVTAFRAGRIRRLTLWGRLADGIRPSLSFKLLLGLVSLAAIVGGAARWGSADAAAGWGSLAIGVAAVLMLWSMMRRWFIAPIEQLIQGANRIAACDLTRLVTRDRNDQYGELQAALNQVTVNLQSIIRDARDQNVRMFTNMRAMATGNNELSQRTQGQAVNLQQTATALEQITAAARATADSASKAATTSTEAVDITERSATSMEELEHVMQSIHDASARVTDISSVIESIAFQTNILALNAAVEAARAGESGRGFAVVASEVRALAQRTSTAAKEISGLIADTGARIEEGREKSEAALTSMRQVLESIHAVHTEISGINQAVTEQLDGTSQINVAIANLEGATQANVSFAAEMAGATSTLEGLAESATQTIRVFRVDATSHEIEGAASLRRSAKIRTIQAVTPA